MSNPVKKGAPGPTPLVLYCTEDAGKAQQIEMLCGQFGYKTKRLGTADADRTVGRLAGIETGAAGKAETGKAEAGRAETGRAETGKAEAGPGNGLERAPKEYRQPELMIFSGVSSEALDLFLGAWRMAGITPIFLKAILTPYNYTWTVYQLTQELIREHTAMMMERRK
ncbi:MAG: DUF3783 domain-containing protein [Lachnospiraceae bacterium]|nr:DUF3783 domain-containing protein [Lachnospiraceae bacterium]